MINGHGDDIHNQNKKIVSNFSSNIYSELDFTGLHNHLSASLSLIHSYPEPDAKSLIELLGKKRKVNSSHILVTNGAVEAIYLIAQTFRGYASNIIVPTFSEYEDACKIHKHDLHFSETLDNLKSNEPELVWICNPNNPTGHIYSKLYLKDLIVRYPEKYFIVDQSYESFMDESYILDDHDVTSYPNLILLHSMTKTYAIPGLRLGYIIANESLIEKIKNNSMPWAINQLAIEAGKYVLNNYNSNLDLISHLKETNRLMSALSSMDGISVLPSQTHFFLCKLHNKKANALKEYLITNFGILIRDASNFRGLDESYFRLATQSSEENDELVKAIKSWI